MKAMTEEERNAEAHYFELREKVRREYNWDVLERKWDEDREDQRRQWFWQRIYWFSAVTMVALGLILNFAFR